MPSFRPIRSRSNTLVRRVRALARSAERRRQEQVYLAEGVRWAEEALAAPQEVRAVVVSPRLSRTGRGEEVRQRLESLPCERYEATDAILDSIAETRTPQGVLLLVRRPEATIEALRRHLPAGPAVAQLWLVAVGVRDPGNLGGLARTARALGASVFVSCGGADLFHPRAVRASAGAFLKLPAAIAPVAPDLVELLREVEARAAAPRGGREPQAFDWSGRCALVLGGEAAGLPREIEEACRGCVTLPMSPGCESLNVGAAAAAILALVRAARPSGR